MIGDYLGQWAGWLPLSIAAVITAILFNLTLLVIGRSFYIKELEAYAQSEMLQAGATFFMAVFMVVMLASGLTLVHSFIAGTLTCSGTTYNLAAVDAEVDAEKQLITNLKDAGMDTPYAVIECRIQQRAKEVAAIQDALFADARTAAQFNALNSQVSILGITIWRGDWDSSLYKSTETKRITNNLATVLIIGLNAQGVLVEYLRVNMLHLFIPMGILLRSFYFTRGAGALMISLGIGMYFIFPVFFILLDPGFIPAPPLTTGGGYAAPQPYCYATMSTTASLLTSVQSAGLGTAADLSVALNANDLSKSYMSLIAHPLVALFLTLIIVRYMMTVLGGDPYDLVKMMGKVI